MATCCLAVGSAWQKFILVKTADAKRFLILKFQMIMRIFVLSRVHDCVKV